MIITCNTFVLVQLDDRVFAKLIEVNKLTATIEFFYSVAERKTEIIDLDKVIRIDLPPETRVFVEGSPGYWRVGRILSHLDQDNAATLYEVRFPNKKDEELSETELYVRCLDAYADPCESLAAGCSESQAFADKRRMALTTIRKLTSSCEGLTGVYSSAIELLPHQILTVRKVMQDNLVRYLLADEVGLGKTIEAGCIIRQMLLDRPLLKAVILVPDKLLSQWRQELLSRFYIDPDAKQVRVLKYSDCEKIIDVPDLLVIDEAHHVIAISPDISDPIADQIEGLAHKVESLLLLSATPITGDEGRLFGLLHLLDPSAYPKTDMEGFRKKVQGRQKIGRILMNLQPGGHPFAVKSQARMAMDMFPEDDYVNTISQELLDAGENEEKRRQKTVMLRDHIARTYRIHDRLIRTRRKDTNNWVMNPRGESWPILNHVRIVPDNTTWSNDLSIALESWRIEASTIASEDDHGIFRRWQELVTLSFCNRDTLLRHLIAMNPVFEGEEEYLSELKLIATSDFDREIRYTTLCKELEVWRDEHKKNFATNCPKIVCFVSDEIEAVDTYMAISTHFGPYEVLDLTDNANEHDCEQRIKAFKDDTQGWILIGSRSSEEGLNLQFVNAIFHIDLPTNIANLEQRIGRLDRFGRSLSKLEHRIFLPDNYESSPWYSWMNVLINGFRIFNESISDIHFKIEELNDIIWSRMLFEGGSCIESLSEQIVEILNDERKKLNEQYTIDQIANADEDDEQLYKRMEDAEEDEINLNKSVHLWMNNILKITQNPPNPDRNETHKIYWNKPLLPRIPWQKDFQTSIDRALTWRRTLSQNSAKNPILLRPGCNFFNTLERISNWDDRGTVYSTWRVDPTFNTEQYGDCLVVFRWIWVLSVRLSTDTSVWKTSTRPNMHRRGVAYLPSLVVDSWTNEVGEPINDEDLLTIANLPYSKSPNNVGLYDINLGSRPDLLAQAFDPGILRCRLKETRNKVSNDFWKRIEVKNALEKASRKFERDNAIIRRGLERRQIQQEHGIEQTLENAEDAVNDLDTLRYAIENPHLQLDECGMMILSAEAPNVAEK